MVEGQRTNAALAVPVPTVLIGYAWQDGDVDVALPARI